MKLFDENIEPIIFRAFSKILSIWGNFIKKDFYQGFVRPNHRLADDNDIRDVERRDVERQRRLEKRRRPQKRRNQRKSVDATKLFCFATDASDK